MHTRFVNEIIAYLGCNWANLSKSLKSRHLLVNRVIALLEKISMHPGMFHMTH